MSATIEHAPQHPTALRGLQLAALGAGTVVCLGAAVTSTLLLALAVVLRLEDLHAFASSHQVQQYAGGAGVAWLACIALAWGLARTAGRYDA